MVSRRIKRVGKAVERGKGSGEWLSAKGSGEGGGGKAVVSGECERQWRGGRGEGSGVDL